MFTTDEDIQNWLKENHIHCQNLFLKDGKVNATTVQFLKPPSIPKFTIKEFQVEFDRVYLFQVNGAGLETLKGCENATITSTFDVSNNRLKSLEFCPKSIGKKLNVDRNDIVKLDFLPKGGITIGLARNHLVLNKDEIRMAINRTKVTSKLIRQLFYGQTYPKWVMQKYKKEVLEMIKNNYIDYNQITDFKIWE